VAFGPSQAQDDLTAMRLFKRSQAKQLVKDGDVDGLMALATSDDEATSCLLTHLTLPTIA
jgi:hypothetical protein